MPVMAVNAQTALQRCSHTPALSTASFICP